MQWLAEVYSRLGRMEEAERLIQRALGREPFSRGVTAAAVEVYYLIDLDEAISYCLRLLELGQTETGLQSLWYGLLFHDRIDEARTRAHEWVEALVDALMLPPDQVNGALAALEETFDAIETYRTTGEPGAVHPGLVNSPLATRSLQIMVGRPEIGIGEVESSLFEDDVQSMGVLQRRSFWAMRDDLRIRALREKILEKFSDEDP
jgi:tetratricopeptide (TPR) repeat protein